MKKPKITEGEWLWHDYIDKVEALQSDSITVCELDYMGQDEAERQANGKAISAVPEMIDALIEANDYIIENASDEIYPKELLDKLEQALKKAGVKL